MNKSFWISPDFESFAGEEIVEPRALSEELKEYFVAEDNLHHSFYDYSFVVLPAAKAYEGFFKKILVRIGYVSNKELDNNPNISVSKYFNPHGQPDIFTKLIDPKRDKSLPHFVYSTYQDCRNKILHFDHVLKKGYSVSLVSHHLNLINSLKLLKNIA